MRFGRSKKKLATRSLAPPATRRLRIRWGRNENYTHLSHLDNIRAIEDAIRRSNIPVTFSKGAHPRIKISFTPPLPVGFTSESEYVDISIENDYTTEMINSLREYMPEGYEVLEVRTVFAKTTSLSESINRALYTLKLDNDLDKRELEKQIKSIFARDKIEINRKTKSGETIVDIRPAIYDLRIDTNKLHLTLGIGEGGYARPTEVAQILFDINDEQAATMKFHRAELYRLSEDGQKTAAMDL